MPRIYAHRGASAELPENTLPAFARATEVGTYGIELDVHLTRDGIPVVIHDETVDRTTNGTGAIADFDYAELTRLDAGDGSAVPTLDQVLDLVGEVLHIDIEVKAAAAADAVLMATTGRTANRFAVSSFDHEVLRHLRGKAPGMELWPLTHGATDDAVAAAVELGSPYLAIDDKFVNHDIVAYLKSRSLGAWVWIVNDLERAAQLASLGVAGICTDDPAQLVPLEVARPVHLVVP